MKLAITTICTLVLLAITACGSPAGTPTSPPIVVPTAVPTTRPAASTVPASKTPGSATGVGGGMTINPAPTAIRYLAGRLGIAESRIKLVNISNVEWPDSSLGCPEAGKAYSQIVTPGFLVTLEANGRKYEVHMDSSSHAVMCGATAKPTANATEGTPMNDDEQRAVAAAKRTLAKRTGIAAGQIKLQGITEKDWPDTSLGCPKQGMMYSQVVTAGYVVRLEAGDKTYEVHTDKSGKAVMCGK